MSYEPLYAFHESDSMWDEMDPLFEETLARALESWPDSSEAVYSVPVNLSEDEDEIRVRVEVPGVRPESVDIHVEGFVLKIHGTIDLEEQDVYMSPGHLHERDCGSFLRMIALPRSADLSRMQTEYHNGVLDIQMPKAV